MTEHKLKDIADTQVGKHVKAVFRRDGKDLSTYRKEDLVSAEGILSYDKVTDNYTITGTAVILESNGDWYKEVPGSRSQGTWSFNIHSVGEFCGNPKPMTAKEKELLAYGKRMYNATRAYKEIMRQNKGGAVNETGTICDV